MQIILRITTPNFLDYLHLQFFYSFTGFSKRKFFSIFLSSFNGYLLLIFAFSMNMNIVFLYPICIYLQCCIKVFCLQWLIWQLEFKLHLAASSIKIFTGLMQWPKAHFTYYLPNLKRVFQFLSIQFWQYFWEIVQKAIFWSCNAYFSFNFTYQNKGWGKVMGRYYLKMELWCGINFYLCKKNANKHLLKVLVRI